MSVALMIVMAADTANGQRRIRREARGRAMTKLQVKAVKPQRMNWRVSSTVATRGSIIARRLADA
jgi:hypothetical protein